MRGGEGRREGGMGRKGKEWEQKGEGEGREGGVKEGDKWMRKGERRRRRRRRRKEKGRAYTCMLARSTYLGAV